MHLEAMIKRDVEEYFEADNTEVVVQPSGTTGAETLFIG
jgi:hypothetical protein